jgi:hypothetical protein
MKFSFVKKHPIWSTLLFIVGFVIAWQIALQPSHQGNWRAENKFLPSLEIQENLVTIKNFRDFYIDENGEEIKNWETKILDLEKLEGMDFIISHFADYHAIAHSFITFRFSDSQNVTISMEARLEKGAKYSPFWGLLNQFEMTYIVASERDTIGSRIGYRNEEVYLYKTTASPEIAQKIFLTFAADINDLEKNPRFYNTLWRNCTTAIVGQIEDVLEENIWWSWEHLLPGYADEKALEMGFLEMPAEISSQSFESEEEKFLKFQEFSKISGKGIEQWDEEFEVEIRR